MAGRSSITRNPAIKAAVDSAIAGGATVDEVAEAIKHMGISRSAVGRYAKGYRPLVEEVLRTRTVMKALREHLPEGDSSIMELAIHKAQMQVLRSLTEIEERDEPADGKELGFNVRAMQAANKTAIEKAQYDQLIRENTRKEAAEDAETAGRAAGATEQQLDIIRRRILGIE